MDIFPQLLSETEMKFFEEKDFDSLKAVLDEVTAGHICTYLEADRTDPIVRDLVDKNLRETAESLTFHVKLKESGIIDLVRTLSPESLTVASVDLDYLINTLSYLEDNSERIRTTIPARTRDAYDSFTVSIEAVLTRMSMYGIRPTYPDILQRVEANKFLFYCPGEKDHNTGVGLLSSRRRQWTITLKGARYLKYCKEHNITIAERSRF